jgi:hypothetical protein
MTCLHKITENDINTALHLFETMANPRDHWSGSAIYGTGIDTNKLLISYFSDQLSCYSVKLTLGSVSSPEWTEDGIYNPSSWLPKPKIYQPHNFCESKIGKGQTGKDRFLVLQLLEYFNVFNNVEVDWDCNLPYFYISSENIVMFFSNTDLRRSLKIAKARNANKICYTSLSYEVDYNKVFEDHYYLDSKKPPFINMSVFDLSKSSIDYLLSY